MNQTARGQLRDAPPAPPISGLGYLRLSLKAAQTYTGAMGGDPGLPAIAGISLERSFHLEVPLYTDRALTPNTHLGKVSSFAVQKPDV